MRAATAEDEAIPTAVADHAVGVAVYGAERVTFNIQAPSAGSSAVISSASDGGDSIVSSAAGGATSSVATAPPAKESSWGKVQTIWTVASVAALAVIGLVTWLATSASH